MKRYRYAIYSLLISAATMFSIFIGCRTTTTTTIEPLQRLEVSPYYETLMRQMADNTRLIEIGAIQGKQREFTFMIDTSAHELIHYLFQK